MHFDSENNEPTTKLKTVSDKLRYNRFVIEHGDLYKIKFQHFLDRLIYQFKSAGKHNKYIIVDHNHAEVFTTLT